MQIYHLTKIGSLKSLDVKPYQHGNGQSSHFNKPAIKHEKFQIRTRETGLVQALLEEQKISHSRLEFEIVTIYAQ